MPDLVVGEPECRCDRQRAECPRNEYGTQSGPLRRHNCPSPPDISQIANPASENLLLISRRFVRGPAIQHQACDDPGQKHGDDCVGQVVLAARHLKQSHAPAHDHARHPKEAAKRGKA